MNNINFKKTAQTISYYLYPLTLGIIAFAIPSPYIFRQFGSLAFYLLTINLFIKPLNVIFRSKPLQIMMTLRREIGMSSFWSYVFHSLGMIYIYDLDRLKLLSDPTSFIFFGASAGIGMYLLGLTSNDLAVRLLKRNWKRLHRVAYLVFFLSLYHSSTATGELWKLYFFGGSYLILKVVEFRKIPFVW